MNNPITDASQKTEKIDSPTLGIEIEPAISRSPYKVPRCPSTTRRCSHTLNIKHTLTTTNGPLEP